MRIVVDDRVFIVKFDKDTGEVANIYERKILFAGRPWQKYWNSPVYNAKNYLAKGHKWEKPDSLLRRVLKAVENAR